MTAEEMKRRAQSLLLRCEATRPVWVGDDGRLRIGRSGDLVQMLTDLRIPTTT